MAGCGWACSAVTRRSSSIGVVSSLEGSSSLSMMHCIGSCSWAKLKQYIFLNEASYEIGTKGYRAEHCWADAGLDVDVVLGLDV